MKSLTNLIIILLIFAPTQLGFSPAPKYLKPTTIILTADQIDGANDIEEAIISASADGTRPGIVVLDGSQGPFVFSDIDRAINIFVSNITVRGVNGAALPNTDGFYFDDLPANNIVIQNLHLVCSWDCIGMVGQHANVNIKNNTFQASGNGINVAYSQNWTISGNTIKSPINAIALIQTDKIKITHNSLTGFPEVNATGIYLEGARNTKVLKNKINTVWQGVFLSDGASDTKIIANRIRKVEYAGILLTPGVFGNKVHANRVWCSAGYTCQTVAAAPAELAANRVSGNKP